MCSKFFINFIKINYKLSNRNENSINLNLGLKLISRFSFFGMNNENRYNFIKFSIFKINSDELQLEKHRVKKSIEIK